MSNILSELEIGVTDLHVACVRELEKNQRVNAKVTKQMTGRKGLRTNVEETTILPKTRTAQLRSQATSLKGIA